MLIKEKIRAMTGMAIFESSEGGKEALRTNGFFRLDFIRWEILKTIVSVTIGYGLLIALAVLYHLEYIVKNATKLDYKRIGLKALAIYLILLIVYTVFTLLTASYRYVKNGKKISGYSRYLKVLRKIYRESDKEDR